jgi:hypothetical protein
MILVLDGDEAARYLRYLAGSSRAETLLRPQTNGPCVHLDQATGDDPEAVRVLGVACRHPAGDCPHLDDEVICPVKDACYAMHDVARTREAYEAPPPTHGGWPSARGWTPTEEQVMREARTPTEAVSLYRAAYPESPRSDASIKSRYHSRIRRARRLGAPPAPVVDGAAGELADADVCAPDGGTIDDTTCDRPHRSLVGQQVRLLGPHDLAGSEGTIRNVCADQVLVALKGIPDRVWVSKQDALPLSIEEVREGSR